MTVGGEEGGGLERNLVADLVRGWTGVGGGWEEESEHLIG